MGPVMGSRFFFRIRSVRYLGCVSEFAEGALSLILILYPVTSRTNHSEALQPIVPHCCFRVSYRNCIDSATSTPISSRYSPAPPFLHTVNLGISRLIMFPSAGISIGFKLTGANNLTSIECAMRPSFQSANDPGGRLGWQHNGVIDALDSLSRREAHLCYARGEKWTFF